MNILNKINNYLIKSMKYLNRKLNLNKKIYLLFGILVLLISIFIDNITIFISLSLIQAYFITMYVYLNDINDK